MHCNGKTTGTNGTEHDTRFMRENYRARSISLAAEYESLKGSSINGVVSVHVSRHAAQ
jgi:hypothetical protein